VGVAVRHQKVDEQQHHHRNAKGQPQFQVRQVEDIVHAAEDTNKTGTRQQACH